MSELDLIQDIEDMYTLTPLQQGMLFHSDIAESKGMYVAQLSFSISREFQLPQFIKAWEQVLSRHAILRTAFLWGEHVEPQQIVYRHVNLPIVQEDIRELSKEAQRLAIQLAQCHDREQKFLLDKPPLMRVTFLQTADDQYTCIWSYHHVLLDGWSLSIVLTELFQYYEALCQGNILALPTPRPYRDYISWLKRQSRDTAKSFWKAELAGYDTSLSLRFDREETIDEGYQSVVNRLSKQTTERLQMVAKNYHLTLSTMLQGMWGLLLGKMHNLTDVVFGATISGRPTELIGSDQMVGLFINTIPVRTQFPSKEVLSNWLLRLQEKQTTAREHSLPSLIDIQGWSNVPRDAALFESIVVLENYPIQQEGLISSTNWKLENVDGSEETHYPLTLVCTPDEELQLKIMYQSVRFAKTSIESVLQRFILLLDQLGTNPEQTLDQLTILTEQEKQQIIKNRNDTKQEMKQIPIHCMFEDQVRKNPQQIAVVWGEESVTFEMLNQRVNQLAHYLEKLGIDSEQKIGVCLPRSIQMVVSLLAILKVGGTYIPLDPSYPTERIAFMLADAGAGLVITTDELRELLPNEIPTICLPFLELESEQADNLDKKIDVNQLAYIIYTSGSTGKPKGVMVEHHSVAALLHWADRIYSIEERVGVLASTSICFDLSVFELFFPLCCGGTVIGVENVLELPSLLTSIPITLVNTVPSAASELVRLKGIPTTVQTINLAGEPLARNLVDSLYALPYVEKVYNLYGPTEDTTYSTFAMIEKESMDAPPIGRPLDNTAVYVLDPHLQPVPIGVPGELYLAGSGLSRGYYNRPDLTVEKFLSHPFAPEERVYRTGDLVVFQPDGNLHYLGRLDHQVKVRGYRIELGEIEGALLAHEEVKQAVVIAKEQQLIAYVVSSNPQIDFAAYLSIILPKYMIPSRFVYLDVFKLTSNGKIDRSKLPDPQLNKEIAPSSWTAEEEIIAGVWQEVLKIENVSLADNFFQLGGHSLLATQVISHLSEIWSKKIPLSLIFEYPTISSLARQLASLNREKLPLDPIPIIDRSTQFAPVSYGQRRLLFLDRLLMDTSAYHLPYALEISGELDIAALHRALQAVAVRHEILRTTFTEQDGIPIQVINQVSHVDVCVSDVMLKEHSLEQLLEQACKQSFHLETGPLWRVYLFQVAETRSLLVFVFHHTIMDGWSLGLFTKELFRCYEANCKEESVELVPLAIQYRDYSAWQHHENFEQELAYWKQQLSDIPIIELPTDFPRPAEQSFQGDVVTFSIPLSLTNELKRISRQQGVTLFMSSLALWQSWLMRFSGQEDIVVGTPITGRTRPELEELIGSFVNSLAIRTNFTNNPDFYQLLDHVRQATLDAYANQTIPFEQLVDEINPERNLWYTPIFQVMFVLQNMPTEIKLVSDLAIHSIALPQTTVKYDLTLTMMETAEGLQAALEYNTALFTEATIRRMINQFEKLITVWIKEPTLSIQEVSILTDPEKALLSGWHQTSSSYPAMHEEVSSCLESKHMEKSIQLLQQGNPEIPPLFFLHGQDGGVTSYCQLVKYLDDEQMIYGIQALGFEQEEIPIGSIEEMIEYYLALIHQIAPEGPYRLAGWSMGGVLAYALTQRLEQLGEKVEFLALLDSTWLADEERAYFKEQLFAQPVKQIVQNTNWLTNGLAFVNYQPKKPIATPIHLFVTEDRSKTIGSANWAKWTSTVHATIVPGDHQNMLQTPQVEQLAASFQSTLVNATKAKKQQGDLLC